MEDSQGHRLLRKNPPFIFNLHVKHIPGVRGCSLKAGKAICGNGAYDRLSAFVRTNALLANVCDRKKSVRQRDPNAHRRTQSRNLSAVSHSGAKHHVFFIISFRTNKKETCCAGC